MVALTAAAPAPEAAPTGNGDWAEADPGSNLRFVGAGTSLRRLLRPDVAAMQRRAAGRALDVRGPLASGFAYDSVRELVVAPPSSLADRDEAPFDTVCSFGALAAAPRLEPFVATLLPLTAPDGRLLFVELDGDAGRWRRRLDRVARRMWGMSVSRDITGALWAGGFEVTSLDRRPVCHGPPGLLRVVVGAARRDPHRLGGPAALGAAGTAP